MKIFADLVEQGLLVPTVVPDGKGAFTINPGKETGWQAVMRPRWYTALGFGKRLADRIIGGIIGAVIGIVIGAVGSRMFG